MDDEAAGLFDVDERLKRLSDIGDQLEAFAAVVDFEMFRPELDAALRYGEERAPPFDPTPADVYFGRGEAILAERSGSSEIPRLDAACSTPPEPPNLKPRWTRPSVPEPRQLPQIT